MRFVLGLSLLAASPAALAQSFSIAGTCGAGPMDFDLAGLTPSGRFAVISADTLGSATVPAGPCAGTPLGLSASGLALRLLRTADASGEAMLMPTIPPAVCGNAYAQVLDLTTCTTSPVRLVDTPVTSSTGRYLLTERGQATIHAWDKATGAFSVDHSVASNDVDCRADEGLADTYSVDHFDDMLESYVPGSGSGSTGILTTPYAYPKHVAVDDGTILVVSRNDSTLYRYDAAGTVLDSAPIGGSVGQGVATDGSSIWVSRWTGSISEFVEFDAAFTQLGVVANPLGLPGNNLVDFAYDPDTGSFYGLVTTGEGGTLTESTELVEFDMGGNVTRSIGLPFAADGIGRDECP